MINSAKDTYGNEMEGHVKIEKYDNEGNVFDTIENHNVVVNDATDIIADALSKPAGYSAVEITIERDTFSIPDDRNRYHIKEPLNYAKCKTEEGTVPMGDVVVNPAKGAGRAEVELPSALTPATDLKEVKMIDGSGNETVLEVGVDVFMKNDKDLVGFAEDITTTSNTQIEFVVYTVENKAVGIVPGTEKVIINGTEYERANTLDTKGDLKAGTNTYGIDYKTGEIWFDSDHVSSSSTSAKAVEITYKYRVEFGINFMGIGNKPVSHPKGYPVVLNEEDKDLTGLRNEHGGARQPLKFPATITKGSSDTIARQGDGSTVQFEIPANKTPVLDIQDITVYDSGNPINYVFVNSFSGTGHEAKLIQKGDGDTTPAVLEFSPAPVSSTSKNIRIDFKWDSGATVNFVADFAPNVPPKTMETSSEAYTASAEQLEFPVRHEILDNLVVKVNGSTVGASVKSSDPTVAVLDSSAAAGDNVVIEYEYLKDEFEIYEVGLFNGADSNAKMFAISGIGPITKDYNTGMRITWSITF